MRINKHDTNGVKPLLGKGELGYDDYTAGGDAGRVYVGTGSVNTALGTKAEIDTKVGKITSTTNKLVKFSDTNSTIANSVIYDDGTNIGIGTNNPSVKVHTYGTATGSSVASRVENSSDTGYAVCEMKAGTGHLWQVSGSGSTTSVNPSGFNIYDSGASALRFAIDSAGNVGIGTSSPDSRLHIASSGVTKLHLENILSTGDGTHDVSIQGYKPYVGYNNVILDFSSYIFKIASQERMRIDSAGNLGLGTSNPTQKISVQGNMYNAQSTSMRILDAGDFSGNKPLHHNYIETGSTHWGDDGFMAFGTQNVERMRITDSTVLFGRYVAGQNIITITTETGVIQAYQANVTMNKPIKLNPEPTGGNVLIGTHTDNGVDKLQVNGTINSTNLRRSIINFTALNTWFAIENIDADSGIYCARNNTHGGSIVWMADPNAGAIVLANNVLGGVNYELVYSPGGVGGWKIRQTSGSLTQLAISYHG